MIRQRLNQLTHWWNIAKELSPKQVERELLTPFRIALVGQPDRVEAVWRVLTAGASPTQLQTAAEYVKRYNAPVNEEFDFVLGCDALEVPQDAIEAIVDHFQKHEFPLIALARVLPGTRELVVNRIIEDVASLNAGLAMVSALPSVFPLLGLLAPPAAVADMVLLTKNQLLMVLRVAAAFGKAPDWKQRLPELASVLGAAFGWRAVARQLVGSCAWWGGHGRQRHGRLCRHADRRARRRVVLRHGQVAQPSGARTALPPSVGRGAREKPTVE
jgi:hypothetical protein